MLGLRGRAAQGLVDVDVCDVRGETSFGGLPLAYRGELLCQFGHEISCGLQRPNSELNAVDLATWGGEFVYHF